MTKEQIRSKYLSWIEPQIEDAQDFADDPAFDKLYDVASSHLGYDIFHPMATLSAMTGNFGIDFDAVTKIYRQIKNRRNGAQTSFVSTVIGGPIRTCDPGVSRLYASDVVFVMRGHFISLPWQKVNDFAISCTDERLISYKACEFGTQEIDFLHTMLPLFQEAKELGDFDVTTPEADKYFDKMEEIIKTFKTYINNKTDITYDK